MPRNPAALAWALLIGSEARVSEQDEREVIAMITTQYMTSFTPDEMQPLNEPSPDISTMTALLVLLLIQQGKAKDDRIAELEAQLERVQKALRQYANRENWGYLDESGCFKGAGSYTDHCVLGPEAAEAAIAGEAGDKEGR